MAPITTGVEQKCASTAKLAALQVSKLASEKDVTVVVADGGSIDPRITKIIESHCVKHEIVVELAQVDPPTAKELLKDTKWKELPLIYLRGNCIGGIEELQEIDKLGYTEEYIKKHDYDLIVVGGGSGGLAAAKEAGKLGKKVACLDFVKPSPLGTTWGLGGTCVNVGCIPKKLFHQASLLGESIHDAKKFGWQFPKGAINHKWEKMQQAVADYIGGLNWSYRTSLRANNVTYFNSYGTFSGSHEITATNNSGKVEKLTADKFLVAVGLRPRYPNVPGAKEYCITSDDLFYLTYNPGKTLCIGASYVSLECAGFLKGIGNDVTVMVRSILLRGFDVDMADRIGKHMEKKGIKFLKGVPTKFEQLKERTESEPGRVRVYFTNINEDGTTEDSTEEYDTVLIAIGRDAKTEDLGMEKIGVKLAQNGKVVCNNEQSSLPHIYAVGDVMEGCPELTPVAIHAGRALMRRLFKGNMELTDYNSIPTTVFTPLEYGCCGMAEDKAIEIYGKDNIVVYHNVFNPLEYTVAERSDDMESCYLKLVCLNDETQRVLGFHILTPNAGEITQGFAIAFKFGATKAHFDSLIGIHPTVAENFTTLNIVKKEGETLEASGC